MALNKNDGTVKIGTELDPSGLEEGMKQAEKKVSSSADIAAKAVGGITAAATLAGSALAAIGSFAIDVGGDFSAAMSQVQAISGAGSTEMDSLTRKAEQMGASTKFSATEAANAMTYMGMAGWKSGDMISGLDGIMNLAAASGTDLATTSDIVTDALTAFGLKASDSGHFADVLAATSSNANTNVSMMGETFKYVAPVAGALGFSAEDCSVAIGLMANAGIKSSEAGTAMRSWLSRMAKPTKESQTAMDELGLSMTNADGSMKSLGEITGDLRVAFSGLTEDEQASYAAMLGGQEAMSGILAIANADDSDYFKLTGAIADCDGAAEKMSTVMQDNLPGDITIAKSALQGFGIATYTHISKPLRRTVQTATNKINELKNRMDKGDLAESAEKIGEAVETIGESIVDFAGDAVAALINTAGWVIDHKLELGIAIGAVGAAWLTYQGFVSGAETAQKLLNTAMSMNPVGLIIAGVAAAGTAFFIYNKSVNKNSKAYEESSKKLDALKTDIETFDSTLETHKKDFKDTKDEINGNAAAAEAMADKLFALAGQSDKTATDEMRLKMMCEELNKLVPDLNIAYDEQTGSLNRTRKEVDELTKSYKKQAIAQAYQEQMKLLGSDYADAVRKQVLAEDEVNRLEAAKGGAEALSEYRKKANEIYRNLYYEEFGLPGQGNGVPPTARLKELWDQATQGASNYMYANSELTVALEEGEVTAGEYIELWNTASDNMGAAKTNVEEADEAFSGLTEEMERVYSEYGITTEATEENTGAVEDLGGAVDETTKKMNPLQKAFRDFATETGLDVDQISETFDALSEKYTEVYNSAYASITGQLGLFDKFEAGEAYTAEEILDNLDSQITGMTEWSNNMQLLANAGIDQGLLKELRDAGPQASAQVKVIADQVLAGNTKFINDLNESYRTKMEIADSIATEFAETETGFLSFSKRMGIKFTTLANTMRQKGSEAAAAFRNGAAARYQDMLNAGVYMSDGLINGVVGRLTSRYGEVSAAVGRINTVARNVMAVYSPSKVMMETGEYVGEGLILGTVESIESGISEVREAVSAYANDGIINYAERLYDMQGFTSMLPEYEPVSDREPATQTGAESELIDYERLSETIARRLANIQVVIDGQSAGYLTAPYINEAIGGISVQEGRGVI